MEEVQQFLEAAVRGSCEGLMVKALGGPGARYDIARRSHNWLKVPPPPTDSTGPPLHARHSSRARCCCTTAAEF